MSEARRGTIQLGNYLVSAYDVDFTPRSASFDFFESYEGIIPIKKTLDQFPELTFKVLLTEGNLESFKSGDDPEKHRKDFIEIRRNFLDNVDGQILVIASEMFKPFKGVISVRKYKIDAGQTDAEYSIEVKGVE